MSDKNRSEIAIWKMSDFTEMTDILFARLSEILIDSVDNGASVGFLPPLEEAKASGYWRDIFASAKRGERVLFLAKLDDEFVGTGQLVLEARANQLHRAEVSKLLVHSSARRRGVGRALMHAIEDEARRQNRSTLVLDTLKGEPSEFLYQSLGWIKAGEIPNFARIGSGELCATVVYYKLL
jgi:GNAT superfamily N-acetyltransferase